MKCECGFSIDACAANPCLRKKVHLAGLTQGSQWPKNAPLSAEELEYLRSDREPRTAAGSLD
jgi:hypothetical protein